MPTPAELLAQSLAKFQTANRIDGNKNSYRKDNPNEYAVVMAYLGGSTRPTSVTSDMGLGLVLEEDARRALLAGPTGATGATGATGSTGATGAPGPYPASYYTGPLGQNNVLPADPSKLLFGVWSGDGVQNNRSLVEKRFADGRPLEFIGTQLYKGDYLNVDTYSTGGSAGRGEIWIRSLGAIPLVSPGGTNWNPAEVAAGLYDGELLKMTTRFKEFGDRVILRWWREMNIQSSTLYFTGDSSKTSTQLAQIASDWIAGWRHVVGFFKAQGATNVGFCWCPSEGAGRSNVAGFTGRDQLAACYPGDAYVDWVGIDKYNHVAPGWSTPLHSGWASFDECLNYHTLGYPLPTITDEFGSRKPIYVWETGSKYDPAVPARKADWFRQIRTVCKPHMPLLRGVMFFDQWISPEGNDWLVDENQPAQTSTRGSFDAVTYQGWKDLVRGGA